MWSRDASEVVLPEGASFAVGEDVGVALLVLQVHYKKPVSNDSSGVILRGAAAATVANGRIWVSSEIFLIFAAHRV